MENKLDYSLYEIKDIVETQLACQLKDSLIREAKEKKYDLQESFGEYKYLKIYKVGAEKILIQFEVDEMYVYACKWVDEEWEDLGGYDFMSELENSSWRSLTYFESGIKRKLKQD